MGILKDYFYTAFRDYVTDGVSGSGANPPSKAEIRTASLYLDSIQQGDHARMRRLDKLTQPVIVVVGDSIVNSGNGNGLASAYIQNTSYGEWNWVRMQVPSINLDTWTDLTNTATGLAGANQGRSGYSLNQIVNSGDPDGLTLDTILDRGPIHLLCIARGINDIWLEGRTVNQILEDFARAFDKCRRRNVDCLAFNIRPVDEAHADFGTSGAGLIRRNKILGVNLGLPAVIRTFTNPGVVAAVVARSRTSNVATITTLRPHGRAVGESITVAGDASTGYNATATIASVPSTTTFTYANTGTNEGTVDSFGGYVTTNGWHAQRYGSRIELCDVNAALNDGSNEPVANTTYDFLHPNPLGCERSARLAIIPSVKRLLPAGGHFPFDRPHDNVIPKMEGTSGTLGARVTGSVVAGWQALMNDAMLSISGSVTCAAVPEDNPSWDDGSKRQRFIFTHAGANTTEAFSFLRASATPPASLAGKYVRAYVILDVGAWDGWRNFSIGINGNVNQLYGNSYYILTGANPDSMPSGIGWTLCVQTEPHLWSGSNTSYYPQLNIFVKGAGSGTGIVYVRDWYFGPAEDPRGFRGYS